MSENQTLSAHQQYLRRTFSKQQVQEWTQRSERRVYFDLGAAWLCIALALVGLSYFPTILVGAAAFLVIGLCQYRLFIIAHDGIHRNLSDNRSRNDWITKWLIYGPMFMGFEDARRNHLKHHQTLGTNEDPDRYLHTLTGKDSRIKFLFFCSGLMTFGKTVLKVTPFGRMIQAQKVEIKEENAEKASVLFDYVKERIPVMVAQPLIFGMFLLLGLPWWSYLVLWIAPIYFLVFLPDELRAFCDHAVPHSSNEEGDPQRLITFTPNKVEALFLSPLNMNYHAEHHIWTSIPYYNLPKAHAAIKNQPEITVRGGYLVFIFDLLRNFPQRQTVKAQTHPAALEAETN